MPMLSKKLVSPTHSTDATQPMIEIRVEQMRLKAFVDTGSSCTLIKKEVLENLLSVGCIKIKSCPLNITAITGNELNICGSAALLINIGRHNYRHNVIITTEQSFPGEMLIGTDLLKRLGQVSFDFGNNVVNINNYRYALFHTDNVSLALTIEEKKVKEWKGEFQTRAIGQSVTVSKVKLPKTLVGLVKVEGISNQKEIIVTDTICNVEENMIQVGVINTSKEDLASNLQLTVNVLADAQADLEYIQEQPEHEKPDLSNLSDDQSKEIENVLSQYQQTIAQHEFDLGYCDWIEHEIDTGDARPIATKQWPIPHAMKQIMKNQSEEMLRMGVIEPCYSPWRSPSLLVKKKDDTYRYCIDFRNINKLTVKDKFPLPRIDSVLEALNGAKYFTSLDLKKGYYQIPIKKADRIKTAFNTDNNTYCYSRMAMGMCNAAATFQRMIQNVLQPVLGQGAQAFLDDVVVYSNSFEQHVKDIRKVFALLCDAGLKVSLKKCRFAQKSLKYLGHIVSETGITVDPEKVAAIKSMRIPRNVREIRKIIGMASYYRRFVQNFSAITAPLTELTKKNAKYLWSTKHDESFEALKKALSNTPVLIYPNYDEKFKLFTDASDEAIGAVLTQCKDGVERPISYFSRKLNNTEKAYTVTEKEALSIVASVKHFAMYLYGYAFEIYSDHAPLRYIFQYKSTVPRITRWSLMLAEFNYTIHYKPGRENIIADPLSRFVAVTQVNDQSSTKKFNPADIFESEKIRVEQLEDPNIAPIIHALEGEGDGTIPPKTLENYVLQNNCLYYATKVNDMIKFRLVVPKLYRKHALILCHDSTLGGHYGVKKSLEKAKTMFYWPNMVTDIQKYVGCCNICQCRNFQGLQKAPIGSLPVVTYPLERVGIDLIGKISPSYQGNKYILTIVCHFSRFVQAYALPDKRSATISRAFFDYVCHYGAPKHCVSDRGSEFIASDFREIAERLNTKLHLTTAFHPESNGQTEAFNKLLKNTLHAMVNADNKTWDESLPCAVLALNCSYHAAIKDVPYYIFHGRDPPLPYADLLDKSLLNYALQDETPVSVFARLQKAFHDARLASGEAHAKNVKYQKCKYVNYEIGQLVFLTNDKAKRGPYSKFAPKWIGPYRIIDKISDVNFKIKPIYGRGKEQVVHVNRLKIAKINDEVPYLPPAIAEPNKEIIIENVNKDDSSDSSDDEMCRPIQYKRAPPENRNEHRYALRSKGPVRDVELLPERRNKKRIINNIGLINALVVIIIILMFCVT